MQKKQNLKTRARQAHWRFKLAHVPAKWDDMVRGAQSIDTSSLSDPVLIRGDGTYLYTLPSVVDDLDESITHIIRGEDHVTNSAAQKEIFEALIKLEGKGTMPTFGHPPLLAG